MSESVTAPVEPSPTDLTYFKDRYPTLPELLAKGGITGVEYCLVSGSNQRKFAELKNEKGHIWSPIKDLPALTIEGPKGKVDTVILMGRGEPIRGSGDFNGIRAYFVDVDVEETVGIPANEDSPVWETMTKPDKPKEPASAPSETGKK
jgi:hypothetical protein